MKRFALLSLIMLLFVATLSALDLPAPPPGFTWQEIPELKAALLKPNGWFYLREEAKGTLAYFITKEKIEKNGQFQTGLTVNVFHLKKDSAVERGKNMIQQLANSHQAKGWERSVGPFREFGCLAKDTDASGTIMMHTLAV